MEDKDFVYNTVKNLGIDEIDSLWLLLSMPEEKLLKLPGWNEHIVAWLNLNRETLEHCWLCLEWDRSNKIAAEKERREKEQEEKERNSIRVR